IEFGTTHANIHQIPVKKTLYQDSLWLSPKTETEETLIENILKLNRHSENLSILHLDFHPLNVLTDGETITSVIDWANASVGDIRFDIARTISILQLEGNRIGSPFENYPDILSEFEKGWIKGYEQIAGNQIDLEIFYKWAGYRMLRDLTGKRTENELKIVQEWANKW
ncbi:MAG TPA: aminoglycoside phosphotransferase family protein, partial [Pseudoneobacillus sp.]|nr:aminoglycoside phosphotransferase family protein [Pseudoneobacillus sp.]